MISRFGLFVFFAAAGVTAAVGEPVARGSVTVARPASAPVKATPALPPSMKVMLVTSAAEGCKPDCEEWISAQGMIDNDTLPQFKKVLRALGSKRVPILIDSGGGVVDDSLAIGRLIRAKGLDVVVSKTTILKCEDGAPGCKGGKTQGLAVGVPVARLAKCASSCAFILAAGKRRVVGPSAFVGVHQVKTLRTTAQVQQKFRIEKQTVWGIPTETRRTLISEKLVNQRTTEAKTPDSAYAKIAKYFEEMGVREPIMPILKSTPNSSIHWLTRSELKTTAMATEGEGATASREEAAPVAGGSVEAFRMIGASEAALPPAPTPKH
ncbi:MAG: hypothetical protein ABL901_06590 [Hyphomicrobiaceae bacterium]